MINLSNVLPFALEQIQGHRHQRRQSTAAVEQTEQTAKPVQRRMCRLLYKQAELSANQENNDKMTIS